MARDICGTYELKSDSVLGKMTGKLVLEETDGGLTGSIEGMGMSGRLTDMHVTGNEVACTLVGDNEGKTHIKVKANFDGGRVKGKAKVGIVGVKFEGRRA